MSGTTIGGQRAAQTNKRRYGKNFYREIGAVGGKNATKPKGFAVSGKASEAGKLGGRISKRGKAKPRYSISPSHSASPPTPRTKSTPDRTEELLLAGDLPAEERFFISDDDFDTPTIDINRKPRFWDRWRRVT